MKLREIEIGAMYVVNVGNEKREVLVRFIRDGKVYLRDAKTGRDLPKGRSAQAILYKTGDPVSYKAYIEKYM